MKKEKILLSLLGIGLMLGINPIVASANYTETRGNITYTYNNNDELISAKFREIQLVADPGGSATQKYSPKVAYHEANLTRYISSDLYGQKYSYLLPDGYYHQDLVENKSYSSVETTCKANQNTSSGNNFKVYSQKYISGDYCADANYTTGGSMSYRGKPGEWRILGYNSYGSSSVENPVFPYDWTVKTYPNKYPWLTGMGNINPYDSPSWSIYKKRALQGAMNLYGLTGSVDSWVDKFTLQTDPLNDTPIFKGRALFYIKGEPKYFYRTIHAPTNPSLTRDLSITKFEVLYGDEVIGLFTRDSNGKEYYDVRANLSSENTYIFRVTVKNSTDADMDSSQLKVQLGYALGNNANASDQSDWFSKDIEKFEVTGKKLKKGESITLSRKVTVSNLTNGSYYRATAVIDKNHYTRKTPDSVDKSNDWAKLVFKVDNGDIKADSVQLIDESGNVVNHAPVPGNKYKIRYNYTYTGLNRTYDFNLTFTNTVTRTLNNGSTDTYKKEVSYKISQLVNRSSYDCHIAYYEYNNKSYQYYYCYYIKRGDKFSIETPYMVFETPKVETTSTLHQNSLIDTNPYNNTTKATFNDTYDIIVSNVRIYPKTEMPTTFPAKLKVGIKYDVTVNVPSYVSSYETDIVTQINSNTSFIDHVKKGLNKDITREIEITVNGTASLPATVHVNKPSNTNQRIWESNYNNNQASTTGTINPDGSNGNLVVKSPENPNNGGCTLSGVNNYVGFSKEHNINNYNGNYIGTPLYKGNNYVVSNGGFYKYGAGNSYNSTKNYNESYKIEQILFKSKLTTDLGLGADGWIDLKSNVGQIKAGYGYDLKIIVNYNTNAITTQPNIIQNPSNPLVNQGKNPNSVSSSTSSGTFVTNRNVMANVPKDIYVRTQDGKVLSASGIYGTTKAFTSREISNDNTGIKVEYTLINNGKIYIDESTKDGKFNITVFTPNVSGISGQNLCDKTGVDIEVKGSMLDDNNDHIVQ